MECKNRRYEEWIYLTFRSFWIFSYSVCSSSLNAAFVSNRSKAGRDITAIDEGGPTRTFISAFCDQMGDLAIFVAIGREEDTDGRYIAPTHGWRVTVKDSKEDGTIVKYDGMTRKFVVRLDNKKQVLLARDEFKVEIVKIPLFEEEGQDSFIPSRDRVFKHGSDLVESYVPELTPDEIIEKAKKFYRAIGRFFLHVIFDGNNTLSTVVLPEMLRNGEWILMILFSHTMGHIKILTEANLIQSYYAVYSLAVVNMLCRTLFLTFKVLIGRSPSKNVLRKIRNLLTF